MRNRLTLNFHSPDNSRIRGVPENGSALKDLRACLTLGFMSGRKWRTIARHAAGYRADRRPLFLPTFPHNERFAEDRFEGLSLPFPGIETFALSNLLHQDRITQDI